VDYLVSTLPHRLDGLTVLIDAANGAAYQSAPRAFAAAGARVVAMNVSPDGRNINEGCGALHPEAMAARVAREGADLGIALDGDADRIMAADGAGVVLDGDDVLFLWTLELIREGRKPALVVGTLMTNFGLELALRELGIELVRTAVGDRYVVEEMLKRNAPIGGEQSGHLIRSDLATTGDGILTGLHLAAFLAASGKSLADQPRFVRTPQVLRNVMVRERKPMERIPGLREAQQKAEGELAGRGRIVLRYSGTEPKARVMVEGTDAAQVDDIADRLTRVIQEAIGA
jgi:phosphoglucosamine mutase